MSTMTIEKDNASSKGSGQSPTTPTSPQTIGFPEKGKKIQSGVANPLSGYSHSELEELGAEYARKHDILGEDDIQAFRQGAVCAQDQYEAYEGLSSADRELMAREVTNPWSQPMVLYLLVVLCSTCAAVQGMGMFSPASFISSTIC